MKRSYVLSLAAVALATFATLGCSKAESSGPAGGAGQTPTPPANAAPTPPANSPAPDNEVIPPPGMTKGIVQIYKSTSGGPQQLVAVASFDDTMVQTWVTGPTTGYPIGCDSGDELIHKYFAPTVADLPAGNGDGVVTAAELCTYAHGLGAEGLLLTVKKQVTLLPAVFQGGCQ